MAAIVGRELDVHRTTLKRVPQESAKAEKVCEMQAYKARPVSYTFNAGRREGGSCDSRRRRTHQRPLRKISLIFWYATVV